VLREHIVKLLRGGSAHATFEQAVAGFPLEQINEKPEHLPYSAWELLEHLRLAQWDILDFMVNSDYEELDWPDDYWPSELGNAGSWQESLEAFADDLETICALALDPKTDLYTKIPHGLDQTYLREFLLVADHNAYHLGQMVMLRRLLEIWG
jgi:hypothetical protein